MGLNFDLLEQLTFYGSYHNNKWNQLIHFIFVPAIMWSLAVGLAYAGPLMPMPEQLVPLIAAFPDWISRSMQLNAPFVAVLCYMLYYLCLEPVAGLSWSLCVGLPVWITSTMFQQQVANAWQWALLVHVLSWYMQIHPGHAVLEGRKPALLDSLAQAFTLAPLFVWFELLFLLGYRPQLYKQLQEKVTANIDAFRKQKRH